LIKEEITSELLRFTIRHILSQIQTVPNIIYPNNNNNNNSKFKTISNRGFIIKLLESIAASHQQVSKLSQTKDIPAAKIKLAAMQTIDQLILIMY
jgi:hypothetical protein